MEIIRGVERRRRWSAAEKLRIVAEVDEPGAVFAQVARRHDISRGQLWNWRRQARSGELGVVAENLGGSAFLPVHVAMETSREAAALPVAASASPIPTPGSDSERIEIVLPDGTSLRLSARIEAASLRRLLAVLRG
jgi:transposase